MKVKGGVDRAVEDLISDFKENPADFNVEKSFQTRLRNLIMKNLEDREARVVKTNIDQVEQSRVKETLNRVSTISRVKEEAQFTGDDIDGSIDLVVLSPEISFYMTPAKKYEKQDVDIAIELKFLKTAASIYEGKKEEILSQIKRLNKFGASDKFFLVFAVKDVFNSQQSLLKTFKSKLKGEFKYIPTPL